MNHEDYIDFLTDIKIAPDKVTILTGKNASGKSLVRKLLQQNLSEALDKKKVFIPHASQEIRTRSNPGMGALSSMSHDLEWLATSQNTLHTIDMVFKSENPDLIVIDEPEIGLGEELQLGMASYLNEKIKDAKCGVLIITHSKHIVKNLVHDNFVNLEGMDEQQWLNREIKPVSIEEFKEYADGLFRAIRDRINSNKEKK
jgi:energy-coupling factor transporter ATP-binding protein EcfA2